MEKTWSMARKILCVRLDSLGDVLMTTPALRALKESAHGRELTLLTSPAGAAVAPLIPELDGVIVYDAPWMKATTPRQDSRPDYHMAEVLRQADFDGAVIFTVFSQNPLPAAFLCYLAGIPLRLAHCRENPYQLLTDWVPEKDPDEEGRMRHEVRRQLDLVEAVGCSVSGEHLSILVSPVSTRKMRRLLKRRGVDLDCPWVVIHPGATAPSRRYPAEGYAEASRRLALDHHIQVIFTGTSHERPLIEEIQGLAGIQSISLVGQLDLEELTALIDLAPLMISNNTGPVHVAAAVGTPIVDLYALTNPQHTPWGVPQRILYQDVPCKFCYKSVCPLGHHDCLRRVPAQTVVDAALELLKETAS